MNKDTVLILGARSDIAMAVAHRFASQGYDIQLAARNLEHFLADKSDLSIATKFLFHCMNLMRLIYRHMKRLLNLIELPEVAVCAVGYMAEQQQSENDLATKFSCFAQILKAQLLWVYWQIILKTRVRMFSWNKFGSW